MLLRSKFDENKTPALDPVPTADYAEGLLKWMVKQSVFTFTVTDSTPLPPIGKEGGGSHLPPPPHQAVINRLKLVAGLDPVIFAEPVQGQTTVERGPHRLVYEFRFIDRPAPPSCVVSLQIRQA